MRHKDQQACSNEAMDQKTLLVQLECVLAAMLKISFSALSLAAAIVVQLCCTSSADIMFVQCHVDYLTWGPTYFGDEHTDNETIEYLEGVRSARWNFGKYSTKLLPSEVLKRQQLNNYTVIATQYIYDRVTKGYSNNDRLLWTLQSPIN
ncbi:hypothetical protein B566_EDAN006052 [Ephemera danica]|nr:hypothetical protein B566_EDAN006052 [Ephemera danica]